MIRIFLLAIAFLVIDFLPVQVHSLCSSSLPQLSPFVKTLFLQINIIVNQGEIRVPRHGTEVRTPSSRVLSPKNSGTLFPLKRSLHYIY